MTLGTSDKYRVALFSSFSIFILAGGAIGAVQLDGQWGIGAFKGGMFYFALLMLGTGGASLCMLFVSTFSPKVADAFSPWRPSIPYVASLLTMFGLLIVYRVFGGAPETAIELYEERWLYPFKVMMLVPLSMFLGAIAHLAYRHGRRSSEIS